MFRVTTPTTYGTFHSLPLAVVVPYATQNRGDTNYTLTIDPRKDAPLRDENDKTRKKKSGKTLSKCAQTLMYRTA